MSTNVQRTTGDVIREPSAETLSEVSHVPAAQGTPEMEFSVRVMEVALTSLRLPPPFRHWYCRVEKL